MTSHEQPDPFDVQAEHYSKCGKCGICEYCLGVRAEIRKIRDEARPRRSEGLLPCPFCGSEPQCFLDYEGDEVINCTRCLFEFDGNKELWNRRSTNEQQAARVAELADMLAIHVRSHRCAVCEICDKAEETLSEKEITRVAELEKALRQEPTIFACRWYVGDERIKIIAYSDVDVIAFLDGRGFIVGEGSLLGNGFGFIPNGGHNK